MKVKEYVGRLSEFIRLMTRAGVISKKDYYKWARENEEAISKLFEYKRKEGMPGIYSLVTPFFHTTLPLVGLNYSQTAHNVLASFQEGWTSVLRLCRGIVFDRSGNLIALAFSKFFNYGEHPETRDLPNLPFEATVKQDGHLGIIFKYNDQFMITTRGDFNSPTSVLASEMLGRYVKHNGWDNIYPNDTTTLVEIIHPQTKVYLEYAGKTNFTVIGAFNIKKLHDYDYNYLKELAVKLGLPATELWTGKTLKDLVALMKDRSVTNQEGYVVRFSNCLRVKLKYETYIGKMVADKLGYTYLMNRMIKGNLKRMLDTLPEEIYPIGLQMLGEILLAFSVSGTAKEKWMSLYNLMPNGQATDYYKNICRQFVRMMTSVK